MDASKARRGKSKRGSGSSVVRRTKRRQDGEEIAVYEIGETGATIGRSAENDIHLDVSSASKMHASIGFVEVRTHIRALTRTYFLSLWRIVALCS